jgi:hypothetical protein
MRCSRPGTRCPHFTGTRATSGRDGDRGSGRSGVWSPNGCWLPRDVVEVVDRVVNEVPGERLDGVKRGRSSRGQRIRGAAVAAGCPRSRTPSDPDPGRHRASDRPIDGAGREESRRFRNTRCSARRRTGQRSGCTSKRTWCRSLPEARSIGRSVQPARTARFTGDISGCPCSRPASSPSSSLGRE